MAKVTINYIFQVLVDMRFSPKFWVCYFYRGPSGERFLFYCPGIHHSLAKSYGYSPEPIYLSKMTRNYIFRVLVNVRLSLKFGVCYFYRSPTGERFWFDRPGIHHSLTTTNGYSPEPINLAKMTRNYIFGYL